MLDKKALSREIQDALETVDPKSENLSKDTWNAVSAAIVKNLKNTVEITKDFLPHTHPELQQAGGEGSTNALTLGGHPAEFFQDAGNLSSGVLPFGRLTPISDYSELTDLDPASDKVLIFDASAGLHKKIAASSLAGSSSNPTITGTAGEAISQYQLVYRKPSDSKFYIANKNYEDRCVVIGMAIAAASAEASLTVQTGGIVTNAAWSLSPGQKVYLGEAGALIQDTRYIIAALDQIFEPIGTALSTTQLSLNIEAPVKADNDGLLGFGIIESNSNAYGNWIKYADGTMECWGSVTTPSMTGSTWSYSAYNFPQPFASIPVVHVDGLMNASWAGNPIITGGPNASSPTTMWQQAVYPGTTTQTATLFWSAVGKWSSSVTALGPTITIGRGIIESGANANGSYIKYEDGTMMQWGTGGNTVAYSGDNIVICTFPQSFYDTSYKVSLTPIAGADYYLNAASASTTAITTTKTVSNITYDFAASIAKTRDVVVDYFVVGRWQSASPMSGNYTYGQGVVETGSNSNGTYIKFDNGTMIQHGIIAKSSKAFAASGAIYSQSQVISFPTSFIDTNYVMPLPSVDHSGNAGLWTGQMGDGNKTVSGWSVILWCYTSGTLSVGLEWTAVGRWK